MNSNESLQPSNISNIIKEFSNLVRVFTIKETEWQIQKEEYERRISELEGELKAHENINSDLLKRIRMLEYALSQERQKNNPKSQIKTDFSIPQNDKDNFFPNDLPPLPTQNLIKEEDLKFLKEKSTRPNLLKVLESLGIDENFSKNLFNDYELNRNELESMIKNQMDENVTKVEKEDLLYENNIKNKEEKEEKEIETKVKDTQTCSYSFNKSIELRSHFDEVRKLAYLPDLNSLISVSEDCLIKVWSMNNISFNGKNCDIEPYLTLRGHTGPLYSVEKGKTGSNLIYTGGNEGIIQIWNIPKLEIVSFYGESDCLFNINVGFFQKKEEGDIIWHLKHHPNENLLISLSSDESLNIWHTKTAEEYMNCFISENYVDNWLASTIKKKAFTNMSNVSNSEYAIPSTCEFLCTDSNKLLVGFNDATISVFDIEKNSFGSNFNTLNEKSSHLTNRVFYQPNCLICNPNTPIIYGGFEDNSIKVMDIRNKSNFLNNSINAHSDSVTSLNLLNDFYMISVSHDTTIKIWDTRRLIEPVITTVGSQKKWDEAMWDSLIIKNMNTLCVACADCTIKLYKL